MLVSSLILFSCSHNSCPAYTYQKNNEFKMKSDYQEKNIDFNRGT